MVRVPQFENPLHTSFILILPYQGQVIYPLEPSFLFSGYPGSLPGGINRPGCEVFHSQPSSVKVKNTRGVHVLRSPNFFLGNGSR